MLIQKIKNLFLKLISFIKETYNLIFEESFNEKINKKFLIIYFSIVLSILFFFAFYLVKVNPIQLLVPFSLFDLPKIDSRVEKSIYVSDGKNSVLKIKRKILISDEPREKKLKVLVSEIAKSSTENILESKEENLFPKKTLNLSDSLISSWFIDDSKKLILDFNEENLKLELSKLRAKTISSEEETIFDKKTPEQEKIYKEEILKLNQSKLLKLEISFLALEKTIFENFKELESIEFKLNGISKDFPELDYKLLETKKRQWTKNSILI